MITQPTCAATGEFSPIAAARNQSKAPPRFGGIVSLCARDRHRLLDGLHRLSRLGSRPTAEFVLAVADDRWSVAEMLDHLGEFASLSPTAVRLAGADRLPAPMLMEVPQ